MTTVARAPRHEGGRARRIVRPVGLAASVGVAVLALQLRDPHRHGSWGLCPFKAITGWDCPLCGWLRAVHDLGEGRVLDAAHSNLLLVASVPVLVALWLLWTRSRWTGAPGPAPFRAALVRPLLVAVAVLTLAFTVYRNTPWGSPWHAA
jgi:hypothetical protein